jgi:O-antigen/teichoic acid export membrane protein
MRTRRVIINIITGVFGKFSNIIFQFTSRTLFIYLLGATYLGVYGLFSQVLSVLSLAELGVGNAIVFKLYKSIATQDTKRIQGLMNFYGKAYRYIGVFILIAGICCAPFVKYMAKSDTVIPDLQLIYVLFVISSSSSYFFIYKSAYLVANQQEYIYTIIRIIFNFLQVAAQLIVLYITKSFIWYLIMQITIDFVKNIYVSHTCNRMYPFLRKTKGERLEKKEVHNIFKDVKALMICKFSEVMVNSTDNIIISSIVGIIESGIFTNYTTILMHVNQMINTIIYALNAGIGNYNAVENEENKYRMFRNINFMISWIFGAAGICLFTLLNPFIRMWAGEYYMFSMTIVFIICFNFYVGGTQNIIWTFRQTMGLFVHGKYKPLVSVVVNLIVSVFLTRYYGIIGVLVGTSVTRVFVDAWFDPWMVHKYGFKLSSRGYFIRYVKGLGIVFFAGTVTFLISNIISSNSSIVFIWKLTCSVILPSVIFYLFYRKCSEMEYFKNKLSGITRKLARKKQPDSESQKVAV